MKATLDAYIDYRLGVPRLWNTRNGNERILFLWRSARKSRRHHPVELPPPGGRVTESLIFELFFGKTGVVASPVIRRICRSRNSRGSLAPRIETTTDFSHGISLRI